MATLNPPKTISKRHELRQDKVVTVYAKAWEFFAQNRKLVYGLLGVLAVIVLGIVAYVYLQYQRELQARELLSGIVSVYEKGEYQTALDGTETSTGLLAIADGYSGTDAGNLAHFYTADALFRLGKYDEALGHFKAFRKGENLVSASALAGEAAVYAARGEFERAGDFYRRAALEFENDVTSPDYLVNAGQAYEQAGAFAKARDVYRMIMERFPDSSQSANMDFYLARVAAEMK